jgi:hypothetical protein
MGVQARHSGYAYNPSYLGDSDRRIIVWGQPRPKEKLTSATSREQAGSGGVCI